MHQIFNQRTLVYSQIHDFSEPFVTSGCYPDHVSTAVFFFIKNLALPCQEIVLMDWLSPKIGIKPGTESIVEICGTEMNFCSFASLTSSYDRDRLVLLVPTPNSFFTHKKFILLQRTSWLLSKFSANSNYKAHN